MLIAITQSLSFWNAFAHKFEEGGPLSTVIEEAETVVKRQSQFDYEILHNSELEEDMATIKNSIMESKNQSLVLEEIKDLLLKGFKRTALVINHNSKVDEDMALLKACMMELKNQSCLKKKMNDSLLKINQQITRAISEISIPADDEKVSPSFFSSEIPAHFKRLKEELSDRIDCIQSKIDIIDGNHNDSDERIDNLQKMMKCDLLKLRSEVESKLEAVEVGVSRCLGEYLTLS